MPCIPLGAGPALAAVCRALVSCCAAPTPARRTSESIEVHGPRPMSLDTPVSPEANDTLLALQAGDWEPSPRGAAEPAVLARQAAQKCHGQAHQGPPTIHTPRRVLLTPAEVDLRESTLKSWIKTVESLGADVPERLTETLETMPPGVPMYLACATLLLPMLHERQSGQAMRSLYGPLDLKADELQARTGRTGLRWLKAARALEPDFPEKRLHEAAHAKGVPVEFACAMTFLPFIERHRWEDFFGALDGSTPRQALPTSE